MPLKCSQLWTWRGQDVRSALQSDSSGEDATTRILLLHHVIQGTPTSMHHLGSTLSLMCFMKRDYKGKSEPNISRWQKYFAHTKVYIFRLKNNYSSSKPFVSACFVVLTKRGGPFITMNGGRRCNQPQSVLLDLWLRDGGDLWFKIYDSLELENKPVLHV